MGGSKRVGEECGASFFFKEGCDFRVFCVCFFQIGGFANLWVMFEF